MARKENVRADGRRFDQMRQVKIRPRYTTSPHGCALISVGATKVLCTAMVEDGVPPFLRESGHGWVTAEYAMLPGSTARRKPRNGLARVDSRGVEIRRLIGRALRAAVDLRALPPCTVWLDCDVLQADGGTRTASVTGAYVALAEALRWMKRQKMLSDIPLRSMVAGVSVGMLDGRPALDLSYAEDSQAEVDLNVVMTEGGRLIEIQGTAEQRPFTEQALRAMLRLARKGAGELFAIQARALRWQRKPWEK